MARSRFSSNNGGMNPRGRIDTRAQSDPAVAAGMRNIHRDTNGSVLSATTADGQRLDGAQSRTLMGSPIRASRLDAGPNTPRLDAMPQGRKTQDAARASALSGALGSRAQAKQKNLDSRKSLFRDMQAAGAGGGGASPEMKARAAALGVDEKGFGNAVAKLQVAPASIAALGSPTVGSPNQVPSSIARQPGMPAAPLAGAAKARQDMATIGLDQAAKNFTLNQQDAVARKESAQAQWDSRQAANPSIASNAAPSSASTSAPARSKFVSPYRPTSAEPAATATKPAGIPTTPDPQDKPAWGQGITAPMPAPAPLGLGQSLAADAQSVGKVAKKAGSMFRDGVVNKAADMVKSKNDAVVTMGERQKGAVNAVAATITGASNLSQKLIPGQTGDEIRSMELPKKAGNAIRSAGNAMSDMSMKPMKAASRFRNAAFGQFKRAMGG